MHSVIIQYQKAVEQEAALVGNRLFDVFKSSKGTILPIQFHELRNPTHAVVVTIRTNEPEKTTTTSLLIEGRSTLRQVMPARTLTEVYIEPLVTH